MEYYVYFLRCKDGSLYIGTTNDVDKRFAAHQSGRGAKYTKAHPVEGIACSLAYESKSEALKMEYFFKTWSKKQKESFLLAPSAAESKVLYQKRKKAREKKNQKK